VLPQSILFDVNSTRSTFLKVSLLFDSKLMRWYSSRERESAPAPALRESCYVACMGSLRESKDHLKMFANTQEEEEQLQQLLPGSFVMDGVFYCFLRTFITFFRPATSRAE
jgi:hypothetical protein